MNNLYPENVINKILEITLETQRFGFISVDTTGTLVNKGGIFTAPPIRALRIGENCLSCLPFLADFFENNLNLDFIPTLDVGGETIVDVHLFKDGELTWSIFIDKSEEITWQKQARQTSNDLRLLEIKMDEEKQAESNKVDFFSVLNFIALKRDESGSFTLLEPASDCFKNIYPEVFNLSAPLYPQNKFLFIENFLIDAEAYWSNCQEDTELNSGPWVERDVSGTDVVLEAVATIRNRHQLLFIKKLSNDYQAHQNVLQIGREGVLIKNQLEDEVRKRTEMIRAREEEIALRLVCAADKRDDGETGSHIRRLGLYSELMATHLGWPQDQVDEIRIAAPMHDIGKIGIPDNILRKPSKLTDDEYATMKKHPEIGGQILSNSSSSLVQMAREIALGHHEKWDGSGYPYGLAGEMIHVSARIVAIVDVFDALIHKRVYKDEMSVDEAIAIMLDGRGKHFDPSLFDVFLSLKGKMGKIAEEYRDPMISEGSRILQ